MTCAATRRGAHPGDLPQQRSDRSPPATSCTVSEDVSSRGRTVYYCIVPGIQATCSRTGTFDVRRVDIVRFGWLLIPASSWNCARLVAKLCTSQVLVFLAALSVRTVASLGTHRSRPRLWMFLFGIREVQHERTIRTDTVWRKRAIVLFFLWKINQTSVEWRVQPGTDSRRRTIYS